MIYFITNCPKHIKYYSDKDFPNITVVKDDENTYTMFKEWAAMKYVNEDVYLGFDVESNGLDAWMNSTVLKIMGDEDTQYVFHTPYCDFKKYLLYVYEKFKFLGHNIKFDLKFLITEDAVSISQVYDTMIAEQRIYMKSGLLFSLEQLMLRYLDKYPDASDKNIRDEFIDCDVHTFQIKPRHIYYGAGDVDKLFIIKRKQEEKIVKYNLQFLIYGIEFPLIHTIGEAELEGWDFNKEKWLEIYEKNKEDRFQLECKMDIEVRRLRDKLLPVGNEGRLKMVGGRWDNVRVKNSAYDLFNTDGTTNTLNLFGEPMTSNTYIGSKAKKPIKIKESPNNINYGSDTQIIEIFGRLGEALLDDKENLVIPQFQKNGKIDRTISYKTGEDYLTIYKNEVPDSIMLPFVKMLLKHRALSTAISTFGANVVNKINKVTGKLHTEFRQANADTGRMQSGGGKDSDKINSQNIPSRAKWAIPMRNCFIAPKGYSIGTHDYSGAELIVMCSLSQDRQLLEASKGDMHSFVAQKCWRAIYKYRADNLRKHYKGTFHSPWKEAIDKLIKLSLEYIVDKTTEDGKIRSDFKPLTFGTIYGMYALKAAKSLKVSKEEGQIVIDVIKSLFPRVFEMVESKSNFATRNGYLVLNKRSKSRAWFPTIIKVIQKKLNYKENWRMVSKEQNEARNIAIQGTQADAVKEATVDLKTYIVKNNLSVKILGWVHDEIIDKHPKYLDGKSEEWEEWIIKNELGLTFIDDNEIKYTGLSFPEAKKLIMENTFNRYLEGVKIGVDYSVEDYWTK